MAILVQVCSSLLAQTNVMPSCHAVTIRLPGVFVVAAMVQSVKGYDLDKDAAQPWTWQTMVMCVLFYLSYFGGIACVWEIIKYTIRKASGLGSGPTERPRPTWNMREERNMREAFHGAGYGVLEEEEPELVPPAPPRPAVQPPVRAAAAAAVPPPPAAASARAQVGTIIFTKVGEKYHTRSNCGHVMGRTVTRYTKCGDCARLDD